MDDPVSEVNHEDNIEEVEENTVNKNSHTEVGNSDSDKNADDESGKKKGKKKKKRVKRRKRRDDNEIDNKDNKTDASGDDADYVKKSTKKRTKKGRANNDGHKKKQRTDMEDIPGHGFGRHAYESAPLRPRMENHLKGPHHKLLTGDVALKDEALVSLRLPRLSPLMLISECWTPAWSVKREQDLRQARYNWIQYQTKNQDISIDINELEPYDLQAKALRVTRMPDTSDGQLPILVPNSWVAKWSDGTVTIHVGNETTLILSSSNDKCVMVKLSKGLTQGAGQDYSYNDDYDNAMSSSKEVDVYTSTGVIDQTWIAKFSSGEGGFEQRKSRLRDILRKSANTKKTVQLLNLNEIAKMSNVQKRQEEVRQNDMTYRRNRERRTGGQRTDLNAAYLDDGDESSYD